MRALGLFLTLLLLTLFLANCATVPSAPAPQNNNFSWDNRVQTLSGIEDWDLKALIAIRNSRDANSANLNWQQNKQNYTLTFFGPLGTGAYRLTGSPGKVELVTANGKKFTTTTPEQLVAEQTGWQLPVSNLYYWIRGIPAPQANATKQFDAYHHLTELSQSGWQIHYLRYSSIDGVDLPSKIFLENPAISIKIIISEWQLSGFAH